MTCEQAIIAPYVHEHGFTNRAFAFAHANFQDDEIYEKVKSLEASTHLNAFFAFSMESMFEAQYYREMREEMERLRK